MTDRRDLGQIKALFDRISMEGTQSMEGTKGTQSMEGTQSTQSTQTTGLPRIPDIELHLWHTTLYGTEGQEGLEKRIVGANVLFDPHITDNVREILSDIAPYPFNKSPGYDALTTASLPPMLSVSRPIPFSGWFDYFFRRFTIQTHVPTLRTGINADAFIDHIQSFVMRDYDILRLDHQPDTKYIEWKNLYFEDPDSHVGYAFHLHVKILRDQQTKAGSDCHRLCVGSTFYRRKTPQN
jgi:hypothetical protein